jgi:hypothetical protein
MAYFSQEQKKEMAPKIKALLQKYGMKGSLSVRNHSSVVLTLREGSINFGEAYRQVNTYWIDEHYNGVAREFLSAALKILMTGNHNNSDIQTDYFDVGWYVKINIGCWNKPYVCTN